MDLGGRWQEGLLCDLLQAMGSSEVLQWVCSCTEALLGASRYNTYGWEGEKGVVLTTNSWMGGSNMFNGIYCLVLGGLYLIASLVMLLSYIYKSRRSQLASQELSWQKNPTAAGQ